MKTRKIISVLLAFVLITILVSPVAVAATPSCPRCKTPNAYSTSTNTTRRVAINSSSQCYQPQTLFSLQCQKNGCGYQWTEWANTGSPAAHVKPGVNGQTVGPHTSGGHKITAICTNIIQGSRCPRDLGSMWPCYGPPCVLPFSF